MDSDEFVDKLIEENKNEFNIFLDTLKEVFEQQEKKGNKHHE